MVLEVGVELEGKGRSAEGRYRNEDVMESSRRRSVLEATAFKGFLILDLNGLKVEPGCWNGIVYFSVLLGLIPLDLGLMSDESI